MTLTAGWDDPCRAPVDEWWYRPVNPIEPGTRGSSEIRRLWLRALEEDG